MYKKLNIYFYIVSIVFALLMSACATGSGAQSIKRDGVNAIIIDNNSKVTYIKQHKNIDRYCASRESDSSAVSMQNLSLGVSQGVSSEAVGGSSGNGSLSLGGRSPVVLITRELMYRVCELSMNLNTDEKTTIKLYKETIDAIIAISKSEHDIGSTSVAAIPSATQQNININKNSENDDDNDGDDDDNDNNDDDDEN